MSEVKFKVGDLVYCPTVNSKISKITRENVEGDIFLNGAGWFENTGLNRNLMPTIFHATQENYKLLSKLYPNVTFEPPPKRKEPKEIIKAMLKAGYDGVPCKTECGRDRYICTGILEGEFYSFQYDSDEDSAYSSGIPYHPKTRQKIIDFVDGEVVLESEDE